MGVEVVQRPDMICTEQRLRTGLSWPAFETLFARRPDVAVEPQRGITAMLATPPAQRRLAELALKRDDAGDTLVALLEARFD